MINLEEPSWWVQLPVLSGPNVELREVEATDVHCLFELLTDPKVSQYISTPPRSIAAFAGFIEWAHRRREAGDLVCFAVVPKGLNQAIGLFQVRALEPAFRVAEWGFAIGTSFWGTGLFQESAVLVTEFALRNMGVHRLEARAVVDNGRGNRALEKVGAKGEAVLRKAFNREYTQLLWSIVAEEWTPPSVVPKTPFDAARIQNQIRRGVAAHQASLKPPSESPDRPGPFPFFLTDSSGAPDDES
jgi:ribosomal-protein-alanine N-acetyltransferase